MAQGQSLKILAYLWKKHINELSTHHATYLQDTPHFLRIIEKINKGPKLPLNAMIVTSDLTGAYKNIPQEDGIECLNEALEDRVNKRSPIRLPNKAYGINTVSKYI
mgnify:CR=1 FL=1